MYPRTVAAEAGTGEGGTGAPGSSTDMWRAWIVPVPTEAEEGATEAWSVWCVPEKSDVLREEELWEAMALLRWE